MALTGPIAVRRVVWHPLTMAGCLAAAVTCAAVAGGPMFGWLALGVTAGFATSGSV